MNLIPSILIYNPLEALVIILLLSFVSSKRLRFKSIIINSYILGTINLICQFTVELAYGTVIYSLLTIITNFIIAPIITYGYSKYIIGFKLNFVTVYSTRLCFSLSTLSIVLLLNNLSIIDVFIDKFPLFQELLMNMFIRIPQFIFLGVMNLTKRWLKNEKFTKEVCREQG